MSNKKSHRAYQIKKKMMEENQAQFDKSNNTAVRSRYDMLAESLAAASLFKIVYLVPHMPQKIEDSSILGWYSEGLHEAAAPLISIAEMPADIRELLSDRSSMLINRLTRQISKKVSPISVDSLAADPSFLNAFLFKVIVSNNIDVSKIIDAIATRVKGPLLHVSVAPGRGRVPPKDFNGETMHKYFFDVVAWMLTQENYVHIAKIAQKLLTAEPRRKNEKILLARGEHYLTAPNETALKAFGYRLPQKNPISEPLMAADVKPERYVNRICESADFISSQRAELLNGIPQSMIDNRYIIAVQSFYWGHFHGYQERISKADGIDRSILKLIVSGTVRATTYFDILTREDRTAFSSPVYQYFKMQQRADAASFTAGLATIASQTLVPVLRLEPKLNQVRGDLKQIGLCARSKGHGRERKLSQLSRKLGERLRSLVHPEYLDRIDQIENNGIEGMKIVADLPIELLLTNGIPMALRYDLSRIPVLPGNLYLANCVSAPVTMPVSKFQKIIILRSFEAGDFLRNVVDTALSYVKENLKPNSLNIKIVDIATEDDFINALRDFDGAIMIFDGHGAYNRDLGAGELVIGGRRIDAWQLKNKVRIPPIVLFSACDTQPIDGSHSSAATAAFALGARAVVGTMLPIHGLNAGVFLARMFVRINEFIPLAVKFRPVLNWREVISGMIRMSHITDTLGMLETNMADVYRGYDYEEVQIASNMAINNRNPHWHEIFIDELSSKVNRCRGRVLADVERWSGFTESLKYIQLGNPENIIIVDDEVFSRFNKN